MGAIQDGCLAFRESNIEHAFDPAQFSKQIRQKRDNEIKVWIGKKQSSSKYLKNIGVDIDVNVDSGGVLFMYRDPFISSISHAAFPFVCSNKTSNQTQWIYITVFFFLVVDVWGTEKGFEIWNNSYNR